MADSKQDPPRMNPRDTERHRVALEKARAMIKRHRAAGGGLGDLRSAAFGRGILDEILAQAGCQGVRFYFGRKDDGSTTLVAVGVDGDGNDLVGGTLADDIWPCPPVCPDGAALDS